MHRLNCEQCGLTFTDEESQERHFQAKQILNNIDKKEEGNLKLDLYKDDEKCLGIFDTRSSDRSPLVILHSDECWYNQVLKQAPGNLTCTSLRDKTELEIKLLSATAPADDTTFLNMLSILLVIT